MKGTYNIKAKAKDTVPRESGWGALKVVMPTDIFVYHGFLLLGRALHSIIDFLKFLIQK
jgi:hypothetical protein